MKQHFTRPQTSCDGSPQLADSLTLPEAKRQILSPEEQGLQSKTQREKELRELARSFSNCFENESDFELISQADLINWLTNQGQSFSQAEIKQFFEISRQFVLKKSILANMTEKRKEKGVSFHSLFEQDVATAESERMKRLQEEEFDVLQGRKNFEEERENYHRFIEKVRTASQSSAQFLDEKVVSELEWLLMTNNLAPEDAPMVQQIVSGAKRLKKTKIHE